MSSTDSSRARRPVLGRNSLSSGSFLDDHQQYKSAQTGPGSSIDGMVEAPVVQARDRAISNLSISACPLPNPVVRDSGIVHSISHTDCVGSVEEAPRLVATIYYNTISPRYQRAHSDQTSSHAPARSLSELAPPTIASGSAPTTNMSKYPLEPPAAEPEPHDHLYGHHISQICLTHFLSTIDSLLTHNPPSLRRLTSSHRCLAPSSTKPRVVQVTFSPPPNPDYLGFSDLGKHESIYRFEREWNCEVILQRESVVRRHKRLCVFDMDSTLIQQEVIDEMAAHIGVQEQVSTITRRAMNGELDFAASLRARVALLRGCPADIFTKLQPKLTISHGARDLCTVLKRLGLTLAVISGGFQPLADWLAAELDLDHAFANHLVSDPSTQTLTGALDPAQPIVDPQQKLSLLKSLAAQHHIPLSQTIAVGDGANDIPMLRAAGLGVAWKAKSKVQMEAPARLNVAESMLDLVYLLGVTEREVDELLAVEPIPDGVD